MPISFAERLAFSRSLIKTKFVVMLADDEIYLPSALNSSIKFLQKNSITPHVKDYALALEEIISFLVSKVLLITKIFVIIHWIMIIHVKGSKSICQIIDVLVYTQFTEKKYMID